MTVSVTLQIPPSVYRLAQRTAIVMSRPVEQVLADVITAASPISEELPPELQTEVDALSQLNDAELWEVAKSAFPASRRREYDRLLEKNSAHTLTPAERDRLTELRLESERLMLHKALKMRWKTRLEQLEHLDGQLSHRR